MFGAPFHLSGDLVTKLDNRWQVAVECGVLDFRDAAYPDDKIGLIFSGYSRYQHQYVGLRVGRSLLKAGYPHQLTVSSGADYLLVIEPNIKVSSGFLGGKSFDYIYKRFLNVPLQLSYSLSLREDGMTELTIGGRWNVNAYHSFPTITVGFVLPFYARRIYQ